MGKHNKLQKAGPMLTRYDAAIAVQKAQKKNRSGSRKQEQQWNEKTNQRFITKELDKRTTISGIKSSICSFIPF